MEHILEGIYPYGPAVSRGKRLLPIPGEECSDADRFSQRTEAPRIWDEQSSIPKATLQQHQGVQMCMLFNPAPPRFWKCKLQKHMGMSEKLCVGWYKQCLFARAKPGNHLTTYPKQMAPIHCDVPRQQESMGLGTQDWLSQQSAE